MPLIARRQRNPFTGETSDIDPSSVMIGGPMMIGGLPEGLNPGAIEMMLKQMGVDINPVEEAIKSTYQTYAPQIMPSAARMGELLGKFGGTFGK